MCVCGVQNSMQLMLCPAPARKGRKRSTSPSPVLAARERRLLLTLRFKPPMRRSLNGNLITHVSVDIFEWLGSAVEALVTDEKGHFIPRAASVFSSNGGVARERTDMYEDDILTVAFHDNEINCNPQVTPIGLDYELSSDICDDSHVRNPLRDSQLACSWFICVEGFEARLALRRSSLCVAGSAHPSMSKQL